MERSNVTKLVEAQNFFVFGALRNEARRLSGKRVIRDMYPKDSFEWDMLNGEIYMAILKFETHLMRAFPNTPEYCKMVLEQLTAEINQTIQTERDTDHEQR